MKLTEEQLKQCVKEYKDGESLAALAKRYGVSRVTVTRYVAEHTTIRKPGARKGSLRPKALKERGPEWDELGKISDAQLAEKVGCARQNVTRVRQRLGIPSARDRAIFERMKAALK